MPKKKPKNNGIPPRRRHKKAGKNARTSIQLVSKKESSVAKSPDVKEAFLAMFEETCGNVSATCEIIGINRRTYYNWIGGDRPEDIEFKSRIEQIRVDDRFIDVAEGSLLKKIREGDVAATIFTLKTKGRHRGWSERPDTVDVASDMLDRVARAYVMWLEDHPDAESAAKLKWLNRFAENGKVPRHELAKKVGINVS